MKNESVKTLVLFVIIALYSWLMIDIGKGFGKSAAELQCADQMIRNLEQITSTKNHLEDSQFNKQLMGTPPTIAPSPTPKKKGKDLDI